MSVCLCYVLLLENEMNDLLKEVLTRMKKIRIIIGLIGSVMLIIISLSQWIGHSTAAPFIPIILGIGGIIGVIGSIFELFKMNDSKIEEQ